MLAVRVIRVAFLLLFSLALFLLRSDVSPWVYAQLAVSAISYVKGGKASCSFVF